MKEYNFTASSVDNSMRVDAFLVKKLSDILDDISRSLIQKYKDKVFVNGQNKKLSFKIREGDSITFHLPPPDKIELVPTKIEFEIIYEDSDILVINKPPGLVVHPAKGNYEKTLVHGILDKIDDLGAFNNVLRPGIVHRLDKDTSGLLIVCKNIKSHKVLTEMFRKRDIIKTYLAIVASDKLPSEDVIDKPIARHPIYRKKFTTKEGGKTAVTEYKVLSKTDGHSLVEINLLTGRTHQIRVHFSSITASIVGDVIYSKKHSRYKTKGLALVAWKLDFTHPATGKSLNFCAKLPDHFKALIDELGLFYSF